MSSFVQKKVNTQWIWIAMDATARQVIALPIGNRSRKSANQLWAKIPLEYRQHATFYADPHIVYEGGDPRGSALGDQQIGSQNNHIERFNNNQRQRVSRLVRETVSLSKKLANHIGAIKLFICHYNLTRAAA
jgi:insertion element IS1 protein InsB